MLAATFQRTCFLTHLLPALHWLYARAQRTRLISYLLALPRGTVIICTKGNTDLVSVLDPAMVPACYGGDLQQLPADIMKQMGLSHVLDRTDDPDLVTSLLPGPTSRLGRFHLPPDQAAGLDPPAVNLRSDRRPSLTSTTASYA